MKKEKQDYKIDIKSILDFFTLRYVLLEDKHNKSVFDIRLIWFLVALFFFSAIVIAICLIALLLGYKLSLINSNDNFLDR